MKMFEMLGIRFIDREYLICIRQPSRTYDFQCCPQISLDAEKQNGWVCLPNSVRHNRKQKSDADIFRFANFDIHINNFIDFFSIIHLHKLRLRLDTCIAYI